MFVTNQLDSITVTKIFFKKMHSKRKIENFAFILNEYLGRCNYFAGEIDLMLRWDVSLCNVPVVCGLSVIF